MQEAERESQGVEAVAAETPIDLGVRSFLAAAVLGSGGALLVVLLGVARTKVLAVAITQSDFARYGQLSSLVLTLTAASGLGLGLGVTKVIAEARGRGDSKTVGAALALSASTPVVIAALIGLVIASVAPLLAPVLLGTGQWLLIVIAAVSVPVVAAQGPLLHTLQGLRDVSGAQATSIIYGIALTVTTLIGASVAGLVGAVLALPVSNAAYTCALWLRTRSLLASIGAEVRWREGIGRSAWRHPMFRAMLAVGGTGFMAGVLFGLAETGVRTVVLQEDSPERAGLFHALNLLSTQVFATIAIAIAFLSFPAVAEANAGGDASALRRTVDDPLRLGLLLTLPIVLGVALFRDVVIALVLDAKFAEMADFMTAQFAGDCLRAVAWALLTVLIPVGMLRQWFVIVLVSSGVYFGLAALSVPAVGLGGAVVGYAVAWGFMAVAAATVLVRSGHWRPPVRTLASIGFIVPVVVLTALDPQSLALRLALLLTFCLALALAGTSGAERNALLVQVRARARRR